MGRNSHGHPKFRPILWSCASFERKLYMGTWNRHLWPYCPHSSQEDLLMARLLITYMDDKTEEIETSPYDRFFPEGPFLAVGRSGYLNGEEGAQRIFSAYTLKSVEVLRDTTGA